MKRSLFTILALAGSAFQFAFAADEKTSSDETIIDATIALARSYLGDAAKLDSVKSVSYKGNLLYSSGHSGSVEMVFQKPLQQKFTGVVNEIKEISALNDTEAWRRVERVDDPASWTLDLYEVGEILQMQASVREVFNFYARPTHRGAKVAYNGQEKIGDRACSVLIYYHGDGVWYARYFDTETGKLLRTVNNKGVAFVEQGEMMVDGIRFPKKLISIFQSEEGGQETMELAYSKIELNREYPKSEFVVPQLEN